MQQSSSSEEHKAAGGRSMARGPHDGIWGLGMDGHPGVAPSSVLTSQVCTYESIHSPQLLRWSARLRPMWDPDGTDTREVFDHRKMWEWLFICESLREAGMLQPGRRLDGDRFGVRRWARWAQRLWVVPL